MPNVKVRFKSALVGAVCAGIMWILWQKFCMNFQFWLTKYNNIYGTFASLPIVLYWLNVNWMIILLGTEICFAVQNINTYIFEQESEKIPHRVQRLICFKLMHSICKCFKEGKGQWEAKSFQDDYGIPIRLINDLLERLEESKLIIETKDKGFVPAKELSNISLLDIEHAISGDVNTLFEFMTELPQDLHSYLEEHEGELQKNLKAKSFADMIS